MRFHNEIKQIKSVSEYPGDIIFDDLGRFEKEHVNNWLN